GGELHRLRIATPVAQKELDADQKRNDLVDPPDDVVVALDAQRLDADAPLLAEGDDREQQRNERDPRPGPVELQRGGPDKGGQPLEDVPTITLPSSVTASSMLTAASPSSISLWARPDGIIGKQFSAGSTTQSKMTGFLTSIISLIASSSSPGLSQRM